MGDEMMTETKEALKRLELQALQSRSHRSMVQEAHDVEVSLRALDVASEVWVTTDTSDFHIGYAKRGTEWRIVVGQRWWSNPCTGIPRRKLLIDADRLECAIALPKLPELIELVSAEVSKAFGQEKTP